MNDEAEKKLREDLRVHSEELHALHIALEIEAENTEDKNDRLALRAASKIAMNAQIKIDRDRLASIEKNLKIDVEGLKPSIKKLEKTAKDLDMIAKRIRTVADIIGRINKVITFFA